MLVSQSVPNLINGVSQQAENLRFPSQCDEQINYYPTVLRGLSKRPPTEHIKKLSTGDLYGGNYAVHKIERSNTERFILVLGPTAIRVFDLLGNEQVVKNQAGAAIGPGDLAYLTVADPSSDLRTLTVADYTFILNNTVAVTAGATSPSNVRDPEALVFVKQARDGGDYTIKLYGAPGDSSPDYTATITDVKLGSTSSYTGPIISDQGSIADELKQALDTAGANSDFTYEREGELIHIRRTDNTDFRVEVECSVSEGMAAFKDTVQNFSLLPRRGWKDFQIKVSGDPEDGGDDYYVKFVPQAAAATGFAEGSWEEAQKTGLADDVLNPATMPHVLVNMGTHFVFGPSVWTGRSCGDEKTNPVPSFVGRTIASVFFRKNRLGFLSGENYVLSEAGEFFNFFRTTVIQLLDSDPVDVGAAHTKVALLKNAVAVSERIVLFSEQSQFPVDEGDLLTPKSVEVGPSTEYSSIVKAAPLAVGNSIYFPFRRSGYSGFMEYAISESNGLFEGFDVTEHCPNYITGDVGSFVVSDTLNVLVAQAQRTDTLYLYTFFKRGSQRIQSSWSKFYLNGSVRGYFFIESKLYVLIVRGTDLCLESMDLLAGNTDSYLFAPVFVTHLDRRLVESQAVSRTYNGTTDKTAIVLPYTPDPATISVATRGASGGNSVTVVAVAGSTIYVNGNKSTAELWIGERYTSTYTMTRPALREAKSDGSFVINTGRFQVRYGILAVDKTLDFRVEVTPFGRPTMSYAFSARQLGTLNSISNSAQSPRSIPFRFPVFSKNDQVLIQIINDSFLPCNLLTVDWEALYSARAQRA